MKLDRWEDWALVEMGEGEHSMEEVRARAASMRHSWWARLYYRVKHNDPRAWLPWTWKKGGKA